MIDGRTEAARLTGGAAVLTIWGITLNEWAAIAAIIYSVLNILILLPKVWEGMKNWLFKNDTAE